MSLNWLEAFFLLQKSKLIILLIHFLLPFLYIAGLIKDIFSMASDIRIWYEPLHNLSGSCSYFKSQSSSYLLYIAAGLIKDKWFQTYSVSLKLYTICLVPKFSGWSLGQSVKLISPLAFEVSLRLNHHIIQPPTYRFPFTVLLLDFQLSFSIKLMQAMGESNGKANIR